MANLGKYEIREQLGTGSMGTVYRARDTILHREVALKTIRTGADIGPEMRERFYREARSCGRLQHPNIVTIYDLGEQDQTAYIAMELLEGADFRKVIEERRVEALPDKLELMIQICEALGHAHRHGVIHRDIKPSNVFLAGPRCVKVLDFGIARLPSSRLTVAGNILGTPNYMAPEQILAKPCDGRADLFSAGVVFFEFVTGQHPFRGSLIPQRIVESEPDSLFDYDSSLPVLLDKVFTRALAKQPEQRYATGSAFSADLRTVLDALRQNSSPTFSRITLPSEREAPEARAEFPTELNVAPMQAPEGEDSAEWRYSEVLGIIPLFEEALDHNDASEAGRQFESLQRVTAGDERFKEAVTGCRVRLEKIRPVSEPSAIAKATSPRICAQCGTGNRVAARFCIQCGADLDEDEEQEVTPIPLTKADHKSEPASVNPVPPQNELETIFDRTSFQPQSGPAIPLGTPDPLPKLSEPAVASAAFTQQVERWVRAHPRKVIADLAAVALIIAAVFALRHLFGTTYPEEHAVAIAKANGPKIDVFEAASPTSRRLYSASATNTNTIRVLEIPSSHSQPWVHVQAVLDGKPQRPGFVQQTQLGEWKGLEAAAAFFICCTFELPAATDEEFDKRRFALDDFAASFPGTTAASKAITEKARLHFELVKLHQSQGLTGDMLREALDSARKDAVEAGEGTLGTVAEIDKRLGEIPPPEEPKPEPKKEIDIADRLARARYYLDQGNLSKSKVWVDSVLHRQPSNSEALALAERIQKFNENELANTPK